MPNTVPAAASGLPSRRTLLGGLALAGAAVGLPVAAKAVSAGTPGVAELSRLHERAVARHLAANDACEAADERVTNPEPPEALFRQPGDFHVFGGLGSAYTSERWWYGDEKIIGHLRHYQTENSTTAGRAKVRAAEIVVAWDAWQADQRAAEDAAGVTAAGAEFDAAYDEVTALQRRIIDLRSLAPDVLRLKVAVALSVVQAEYIDQGIAFSLERHGPTEDAVALSVLRDLVAAQQAGGLDA